MAPGAMIDEGITNLLAKEDLVGHGPFWTERRTGDRLRLEVQMAASALVMRPGLTEFAIVSEYYRMANREPTTSGVVRITKTETFKYSFLDLVRTIVASSQSRIVIVSHGNPYSGLLMPVNLHTVQSIGEVMAALLALVENIAKFQGNATDASTVYFLTQLVQRADIAVQEALELARLCLVIRSNDSLATEVYVRGCQIGTCKGGQPTDHILRIKQLFKSRVVDAPKCPMFYTSVTPVYPRHDVRQLAKSRSVHGRRYLYETEGDDPGPMLLDIEYKHATASADAYVQASADIQKWARILHENAGLALSGGRFAVGGMYPDDDQYYYLADESEYARQLASVR